MVGTKRRTKLVAAAGAAVLFGLTGWGVGTATANSPAVSASRAHQPANIGQVKNDVEAYYGDYKDASGHHHASQRSQWAKQTRAQVKQAKRYLRDQLADGVKDPAIVLDVDDTSELTYGWEADSDFGFDEDAQEKQINAGNFPAIKPTRELTRWATDRGVRLYFLTGRPEHQRAATVRNLRNEGYPKPAGVFLQSEGEAPSWLPCGSDCDTVQYKSGTREHIEKLGNTIVLNIGDQNSDLQGGHAKRGVKLPNPMYYLP